MRRFVCLAVVCLAFVACGDSDPTGPESEAAGRYTLISVNGMPLPAVLLQVLENRFEVLEGHFQLNADGTCSGSITGRATTDGVVTTETEMDTCTWTLNNTVIVFTYPDGDTDVASLIDGIITITDEGVVFVFQK